MKFYLSIIAIFTFIFFQTSNGQTNLVLNGGFEDTIACPVGGGDINKTKHWIAPTMGTPDYYNACNIYGLGVPSNALGWANAEDGVAYAGISTYNEINTREYIQGELSDSLKTGERYIVSFYASPSDRELFYNNSLGAYLSVLPIWRNDNLVLEYIPQISNTNALTDTSSWSLITDTFIAFGGEKFITIGNFLPDGFSDTIRDRAGPPLAYYYIDNVSVIKDSTTGINETTKSFIDLSFYPNPVDDEITIHSIFPIKGKLIILDELGKVLFEEKFSENKTFNLSFLLAGVYFFSIETEKKVFKEKFVKLK